MYVGIYMYEIMYVLCTGTVQNKTKADNVMYTVPYGITQCKEQIRTYVGYVAT